MSITFVGKEVDGIKKKSINIFVDFLCPYCGKFEANYATSLKALLDLGYTDVTYTPLVWIDQYSNGYHYSIRAALAVYVVQEEQPEILWNYITKLFQRGVQPREADNYIPEDGSNEKLANVAKSVGASDITQNKILKVNVESSQAKELIQQSTNIAESGSINGTPSVFINNRYYLHSDGFSSEELIKIFPQIKDDEIRKILTK